MSKDFLKSEFAEVGQLLDTPEYGLVIQLTYGKPLTRLLKAAKLFEVKLEVAFKKLIYQRSGAQNRWLWGVAYTTVAAWYREANGERISKDALHAHTLKVVMGQDIEVKTIYGVEVMVAKVNSTSKLNTVEFTELMEKLIAYWAEKGCEIPLPRENNFLSDFLKDE